MTTEIDLTNPPATAPGNAHPTIWGMAYTLYASHISAADGFCVVCRPPQFSPCPPSRLARRGLALALRVVM